MESNRESGMSRRSHVRRVRRFDGTDFDQSWAAALLRVCVNAVLCRPQVLYQRGGEIRIWEGPGGRYQIPDAIPALRRDYRTSPSLH